jgi:hypothetical protein
MSMRAQQRFPIGVASSIAAVIATTLLSSAAGAQTIFRCGDSYSQSPCANATIVDVVAPPSALQRSEARDVAAREKLLALEMVRDRREREQAVRPAMAGSLGPTPPAVATSAPAHPKKHVRAKKRPAADDAGRDFIATVPRAKK